MDNVNHPSHYTNQGSVECIDFIEVVVSRYRGVVAFDLANTVKYLWRFMFKNGLEDIDKAVWYASHACESLQKKKVYIENELFKVSDEEIFETVINQFKGLLHDDGFNLLKNVFIAIADGTIVYDNNERYKFMDNIVSLRNYVAAETVEGENDASTAILVKKLVQATDDEYEDCEMTVDFSELKPFAQVKMSDGKVVFVNMNYVTSFEVATESDIKIVTE